jgi:hypothetical protein
VIVIILITLIAFHIVAVSLGVGIVCRMVPAQFVADMIGYLHNAIGITTPSHEQVRMAALIWIGSVIFIVDGILLFFVLVTSMSLAR